MRKRIKQYALITCCSLSMLASLVGCGKKAKEETIEPSVIVTDVDDVAEAQLQEETTEAEKENKKDEDKDDKKEDKKEDKKDDKDSKKDEDTTPVNPKKPSGAKQPSTSNNNSNGTSEADRPASGNTNNTTPDKPAQTPDKPAQTPDKPEQTPDKPETDPDTSNDIKQYEGYDLVWHDEFSGTALNTNDWNYEVHEKGWVNCCLAH